MRLKIFLILAALFALIVRAWAPVEPVIMTHWIFNYQGGFVKRGLFGEIIYRLGMPLTERAMTYGAWTMAAIAGFSFMAVIVAATWTHRKNFGIYLFSCMALLCPGTIQHMIFEAGRYDAVGVIFLTFGLFALPRISTLWGTLLILFLSIAGILIHEAFFVMFLPLLLIYWIYLTPSRQRWSCALIIFLISLACATLTAVYGVLPRDTYMAHAAYLRMVYGNWIEDIGVYIFHSGGAEENFHLTVQRGLTWARLFHHIMLATLVLLPLAYLFKDVFKGPTSILKTRLDKLLFFSAFSPLLMYPLGHDHFRWWSVVITNFFIVNCIFLMNNPAAKDRFAEVILRNRYLLYAIIAISLLVGPIKDTRAF